MLRGFAVRAAAGDRVAVFGCPQGGVVRGGTMRERERMNWGEIKAGAKLGLGLRH